MTFGQHMLYTFRVSLPVQVAVVGIRWIAVRRRLAQIERVDDPSALVRLRELEQRTARAASHAIISDVVLFVVVTSAAWWLYQ